MLIAITMMIAFCFSLPCAKANSPLRVPDFENLKIEIFSPADSIEINRIFERSEKLKISFTAVDGVKIQIAEFVENGAPPETVSIFKDYYRARTVIFAIVKWHYYLSGVDTEADFYEIHAYDALKNSTGKISFPENKKLLKIFGSGMDGKKEGTQVRFRFKDAASIRKTLDEIRRLK